MNKGYELVVRSDSNYDNLIVEIIFDNKKVGLIISQETQRTDMEVSVFSLFDDSKRLFYETEKNSEVWIDISVLMNAINEAKNSLLSLDTPR